MQNSTINTSQAISLETISTRVGSVNTISNGSTQHVDIQNPAFTVVPTPEVIFKHDRRNTGFLSLFPVGVQRFCTDSEERNSTIERWSHFIRKKGLRYTSWAITLTFPFLLMGLGLLTMKASCQSAVFTVVAVLWFTSGALLITSNLINLTKLNSDTLLNALHWDNFFSHANLLCHSISLLLVIPGMYFIMFGLNQYR